MMRAYRVCRNSVHFRNGQDAKLLSFLWLSTLMLSARLIVSTLVLCCYRGAVNEVNSY